VTRLLTLAVCLGLAGCPADEPADQPDLTPPAGPLPADFAPVGDEFLVAVLPDTQVYAWQYPETFHSQLRWLAEWADTYNIVFVTHVGDIVQHGNALEEWAVATAAYDWLDDVDLPHGFSIGGHDVSMYGETPEHNECSPFSHIDCDAVNFQDHFGPERYAGRSWYGGASPSGQSNYQLVDAGAMQLLFMHLPQDTPRAEVDWAHEVLDAHPGVLAHLTTHRYLLDYRLTDALPSPLNLIKAGRFSPLTYLLGGQSLMYLDGLEADDLFNELIATHPNIWAVHCGHVDAEYHQQAVNSAGLPVHEILVDFQDMSDGGGGWLRLLRFRPARKQVEVLTFSTVTGEVRGNGDGFEHSLEILGYYRDVAGEDLERFGADQAELDALLEDVQREGEVRETYRSSLYDDGSRDSRFVLEVDFQAYLEASR
jgi:hypothetical protein